MATVVNFNGRQAIEPGAYATTAYNPTSIINVAEFGNVLIIDTGQFVEQSPAGGGATLEFAGGSGTNGTYFQDGKSVYEFESIEEFRDFMGGGGVAADAAYNLFSPRTGSPGTPKLLYTRAATTVPATLALTGSDALEILTLNCKNEGKVGNGVIADGQLKVGFAAEMVGDETNGYTIRIYRGNYGGRDVTGDRIGTHNWDAAKGELIIESPVLKQDEDATEFKDWVATDFTLNSYFKASTGITGDVIPEGQLEAISLAPFTGGTTTYLDERNLQNLFDAIEEMDITFFLGMNTTLEDADSPSNLALLAYIVEQAKYGGILCVAGGVSGTDLLTSEVVPKTSQSVAKVFNNAKAVVIHGSPEVVRRDNPRNTKQLPSFYLLTQIIGLNAGGEAQTPLTFKTLGYQSYAYDLKRKEREKALQAGVMHVRNVSGTWVVNQGITTLQDNKQTYDAQGNSIELSVELIKLQVNKELIIESNRRFIGNTIAQATPVTVKNFTETKLQSLTAELGADNLILNWANVKVSAVDSDYRVTYDFVPNLPLNKLFFIGNIVDYTATA